MGVLSIKVPMGNEGFKVGDSQKQRDKEKK